MSNRKGWSNMSCEKMLSGVTKEIISKMVGMPPSSPEFHEIVNKINPRSLMELNDEIKRVESDIQIQKNNGLIQQGFIDNGKKTKETFLAFLDEKKALINKQTAIDCAFDPEIVSDDNFNVFLTNRFLNSKILSQYILDSKNVLNNERIIKTFEMYPPSLRDISSSINSLDYDVLCSLIKTNKFQNNMFSVTSASTVYKKICANKKISEEQRQDLLRYLLDNSEFSRKLPLHELLDEESDMINYYLDKKLSADSLLSNTEDASAVSKQLIMNLAKRFDVQENGFRKVWDLLKEQVNDDTRRSVARVLIAEQDTKKLKVLSPILAEKPDKYLKKFLNSSTAKFSRLCETLENNTDYEFNGKWIKMMMEQAHPSFNSNRGRNLDILKMLYAKYN